MSRASRMTAAEARIQRHIYKRLVQALDGRSWNWLAKESGVPQTTLSQQVAAKRFSLPVLIQITGALKIPLVALFPGGDAEVEAGAFRRIRELVERIG